MARIVLDIERPTVGLLNVGTEEIKGLEEVKAASRLLREAALPGLDYHGFVEGDDLGAGSVDVVVTEGFSGNIALKTAEGTAKQIRQYIRSALGETWRAKLAYLIAREAFDGLRAKMDVRNINGGVFLGLDGRGHQEPRQHGCRWYGWRHRPRTCDGAARIARQNPRHAKIALALIDPAEAVDLATTQSTRTAVVAAEDRFDVMHSNRCLRSVVKGAGSYLPETVLTNRELADRVDTSDEWIVQRTGITRRHIAAADETTSTLALKAAQAALADAGLHGNDIDLLIVATSTPDFTFPSVATQVQAGIGMTGGAAFDVQAVCSGFVFAVATADKFLVSGSHRRALVIGAETFSRILDWKDRTTCVLFGDGAAALIFEAQPGEGTSTDRGVLTSHLRSDGRHHNKLQTNGGPSSTQTAGHVQMAGKEVFRHAVGMVSDVVEAAFAASGTAASDLDWFVPHQANRRIIDASADKLKIDKSKVVVTVDRHANTSAASIPLALSVALADGRIKVGDLVMIEAMGGGFTWGRRSDPLVARKSEAAGPTKPCLVHAKCFNSRRCDVRPDHGHDGDRCGAGHSHDEIARRDASDVRVGNDG